MNPYERKKILAEARQLFNEKAYPDALQRCKILLDRSAPQVDVLALKALIHQQSGNLAEAGKSLGQALGLSPDDPGMLITAALINRKLENSDLALKQAMKAARAAPNDPKVVCQCASIIGSLGERRPGTWWANTKKHWATTMQQNSHYASAWRCNPITPGHAACDKIPHRSQQWRLSTTGRNQFSAGSGVPLLLLPAGSGSTLRNRSSILICRCMDVS
jgi:tetratricopeptide (TPR) repeat protein